MILAGREMTGGGGGRVGLEEVFRNTAWDAQKSDEVAKRPNFRVLFKLCCMTRCSREYQPHSIVVS